MEYYPTPVVLDTYFELLTLAGEDVYRPIRSMTGGLRRQLNVVIGAKLLKSKMGSKGGYMLTHPLSDMCFSELIALWSDLDNPLARLFSHWGDCSVQEVLQWPVPNIKGTTVTFHATFSLLKMLDDKIPKSASIIAQPGRYGSYAKIFLTSGVKHGFLARKFPAGYVLVKPFEEMTVGDILLALSHRGKINSAALFHSRDILLKDI